MNNENEDFSEFIKILAEMVQEELPTVNNVMEV